MRLFDVHWYGELTTFDLHRIQNLFTIWMNVIMNVQSIQYYILFWLTKKQNRIENKNSMTCWPKCSIDQISITIFNIFDFYSIKVDFEKKDSFVWRDLTLGPDDTGFKLDWKCVMSSWAKYILFCSINGVEIDGHNNKCLS